MSRVPYSLQIENPPQLMKTALEVPYNLLLTSQLLLEVIFPLSQHSHNLHRITCSCCGLHFRVLEYPAICKHDIHWQFTHRQGGLAVSYLYPHKDIVSFFTTNCESPCCFLVPLTEESKLFEMRIIGKYVQPKFGVRFCVSVRTLESWSI